MRGRARTGPDPNGSGVLGGLVGAGGGDAGGPPLRELPGGRVAEAAEEDVSHAQADDCGDDRPQPPQIRTHEQQQREHRREDADAHETVGDSGFHGTQV